MAGWFRLWHDMPTDPKWRVVSRKSGQPISVVMSVYLFVLTSASCNAEKRGETQGLRADDIAAALDVEEGDVVAILDAMQGRVLEGDKVTGWEKRQPRREDSSSERVKRWRERNVTQRNAPDADADADADIDSDREKRERGEVADAPVAVATPDCPHSEIVALYNSRCPALPRVRELTDLRRKALRTRWRESHDRQSLDWWRAYFDRVAASPFLNGSNDRNWLADFDWLLKPGNLTKVSEGRYAVAAPKRFSDRTTQNIETLREWANGTA